MSADSMMSRGISRIARVVGPASDRFHTTLRIDNASLAEEWLALLKNACGRQRNQGMEKLQGFISRGEVRCGAAFRV